jgi:formylglycine-generating enzyme required for sulfatase activity
VIDELLSDAAAFFEAAPSQRGQAVLSALPSLPEGFSVVSAEGRLFSHAPTGLTFVLIPGGRLEMGLSDEDIDSIHEQLGSGFPVDDFIERAKKTARPVHSVLARPFMCSFAPLSSNDVRRLSRGKRSRDTFARAEATALAAETGFRLPSEAELEWLRRDGTDRTFTLDAAANPERAARGTANARMAVDGLLMSEWAADDFHPSYSGAPVDSSPWMDGDPAGVYRAGTFLPVQHPVELIDLVAAFRSYGLDEDGATPDVMMRLACTL